MFLLGRDRLRSQTLYPAELRAHNRRSAAASRKRRIISGSLTVQTVTHWKLGAQRDREPALDRALAGERADR